MDIKVDEIIKIIRKQIEGYEKQTDLAEIGTVISVGDGICRIYGLEKVMYQISPAIAHYRRAIELKPDYANGCHA